MRVHFQKMSYTVFFSVLGEVGPGGTVPWGLRDIFGLPMTIFSDLQILLSVTSIEPPGYMARLTVFSKSTLSEHLLCAGAVLRMVPCHPSILPAPSLLTSCEFTDPRRMKMDVHELACPHFLCMPFLVCWLKHSTNVLSTEHLLRAGRGLTSALRAGLGATGKTPKLGGGREWLVGREDSKVRLQRWGVGQAQIVMGSSST